MSTSPLRCHGQKKPTQREYFDTQTMRKSTYGINSLSSPVITHFIDMARRHSFKHLRNFDRPLIKDSLQKKCWYVNLKYFVPLKFCPTQLRTQVS